ncbi:unnamed protein product [Urochloa decumbens]|uniref:Fatty acid desaturase domain-containing protein n=1 Tax=Urochloa decumbens TaxID=240449 RepID=A0ABC9BYC1_9POAL
MAAKKKQPETRKMKKKLESTDVVAAPPDAALPRSPTDKPPFTMSDIRNAIPPHCFRRSLLRDLAVSVFLLWLAAAGIPNLPHLALRLAALLAPPGQRPLRRMGNRSRVRPRRLLRPRSPQRPPRATSATTPTRAPSTATRSTCPAAAATTSPRTPTASTAAAAARAVLLAVGWPMYLAFNTWGRAYPRWASHLDPFLPVFAGGRERALVAVSDAASLALYKLSTAHGVWAVVNAWLVLVTYLHHTHAGSDGGWDWLRGALSTVDRDYGVLGRLFFHNIADTHVAHHLFPGIPHYHAAEATAAIRPVLGEYYRFDPTPFTKAVWREVRECIYVEPDEDRRSKDGVFWYSNKF